MSKYTSLMVLFALFFVGCDEKKDATTVAPSVRKIELTHFIVLSVEDIQGTNLSKVIVAEENHNEWRLCLVAPKQSLLKVDTGEKVEVVFIEYFSDSRGDWESIPVLKN